MILKNHLQIVYIIYLFTKIIAIILLLVIVTIKKIYILMIYTAENFIHTCECPLNTINSRLYSMKYKNSNSNHFRILKGFKMDNTYTYW